MTLSIFVVKDCVNNCSNLFVPSKNSNLNQEKSHVSGSSKEGWTRQEEDFSSKPCKTDTF